MLKKLFAFFSTFLVLFSFSSCTSKNASNEKSIVLVMAEGNPADSVVGLMDLAFKRKVEELSSGRIKIDLHCAGILGDEKQVMSLIVKPESSIQLARVSASLASYGGEKSRLLTIPYTFLTEEHFWEFADSPLADEILEEPYQKGLGVKGLFYGEEGFRHFFSTVPINSLSDIENKNVRVSNAKIMQDLVYSLKANPVEVTFSDLYSAMLRGETEVADQPITNYLSNHFYEVAKYMIMDGHTLGAVQVVINSSVWDSLSEEQQQILKIAGKYASDYCRKIIDETERSAFNELKKIGTVFTEVSDKTVWQAACDEMIKDSSSQFPDLYKKILGLGKNNGEKHD
ncbi:TRAP transporter substrate-binding protein [Treponema zioleckii]|uniref:TRAP transporter substrate-binding protein n=1 Tax=Treponema zioleckii TaxID=331680 RepID=UPI00168A6112|nr:TRAP transporter substrate-binding protein [Treponema zioleckii]